jgi:hypothetical protein
MKKLVGLTVVIMFFSLTVAAQGQRQQKRTDYTPEQRATLQTKKLALRLDLTANQEKEVKKLMLKNAEERQELRTALQKNKQDGTGLTGDERFERENMRLTKQQSQKAEMKKILTEEQYEKWENFNQKALRNANKKKGNSKGTRNSNNSKKQYNNRG